VHACVCVCCVFMVILSRAFKVGDDC